MPSEVKNYGVLLPTRGVLVYAHGEIPRVELNWQMAETAERMGYDSVWVGDSITSKPRLEPLNVMAAIAARTHRVKIGTAVMLTALRHPVHLAHSVATLDNISNGRIILGVGAGRADNAMYVKEHTAVGVPIEERADRMEQGLEIMRSLWTQPSVTRRGGYYPLEEVALEPKPVQQPLPIWVSSNLVKRGLWRTAKFGDGWITNVPTPEAFRESWHRISQNAQETGRDISQMPRCLYISINLNNADEAMREGGQFMLDYYGRPYEAVSRQLLCVFAPPQKVADTILRYKEEGANYFIVRFATPNQMKQLDTFAEKVLPMVT